MKRAVFLDRDGVINKDTGLVHKKTDIIFFEGVKSSLELLRDQGFYIIVVTNQPVVARGLIDKEGVEEINNYINSKLGNAVDQFYFCPHHPNADMPEYRKVCNCRKPSSGMILKAKVDFDIDLNESWMIGDRISDIICGSNVGCKTILIKSENCYKMIESGKQFCDTTPDYFFENISSAAKFIAEGRV